MPRTRLAARETPSKPRTARYRAAGPTRHDDVPNVYREMLAEAAGSDSNLTGNPRPPSKKRKVNVAHPSKTTDLRDVDMLDKTSSPEAEKEARMPEHIIYEDIDESSEPDDFFEDVNLEPGDDASASGESPERQSLKIDLSNSADKTPRNTLNRRKPVSRSEQALRLSAHKWHVLCLLSHLDLRNRWCDSDEIHTTLKPLVPKKTISLLHLEESRPQFQRVQSFHKAIEEISTTWRGAWQTNVRGLRRAFWKNEVDIEVESEQAEDPIDFKTFKAAAMSRSGSRDLGAQLFCALLRSVAVEARLVCSLQPLPFSAAAKGVTPQRPHQTYIHAPAQSFNHRRSNTSDPENNSNPRWRMSDHSATAPDRPNEPHAVRRKVKDSAYPIFWVEVFSPAATSWIPVDPLVRRTINKPKTGFEPPAADQFNSMSYVVAFEEDGSAKDVTRRYVQYPNAKTRKLRVESTKGGQKWWGKVMHHFEKIIPQDRDGIEDADLARQEAAEPMPKNIQDFKGHPLYVLERHLRRNEVVHPRRDVGKIGTRFSKSRDDQLENVYRRRDVHIVRTADQWYRRGRDVRAGEVGLKRAQNNSAQKDEGSDDEDDANEGTAQYAEFQTDIYVPPPTYRGRVPKNAYGNIDVYVSTMIPPGAIHIQHPDATAAARALGISYADAVTGFSFKGRQGTAVINGIVVAQEFRDALVEVIERLEYERIRQEEARRTLIVLQTWKRFHMSLRVRKQVAEEYESNGDHVEKPESARSEPNSSDDGGGGFVVEQGSDIRQGLSEDYLSSAVNEIKAMSLPPAEVFEYHKIIITESPHTEDYQIRSNSLIDRDQPSPDRSVASQLHRESTPPQEPGGFLVDENAENSMAHCESVVLDKPLAPDSYAELNNGGGFIVEDLPEDYPRGDQPSRAERHLGTRQATERGPLPRPEPSDGAANDPDHAADETSSLLSHDPEDEDADADMDWLMMDE